MKVYLDDVRKPPEGWTLFSTPITVINLLKHGVVEELSLDHDLGDDEHIGTGYDVLLWIEEKVITENFKPPKIHIHTDNSSARIKMKLALDSILKHSKKGKSK